MLIANSAIGNQHLAIANQQLAMINTIQSE